MPKNSPYEQADYRLRFPQMTLRDGVPYAADFDDTYYSAEDGLAEARHVFLNGNDLAVRMARAAQEGAGNQRAHITIAETGFGSGLNCLAVMAEIANYPALHVDYISFEAHPLSPDEMAAAHLSFPQIAAFSETLRRALPPRWPGYHLAAPLGSNITLHLHYGDAATALADLDFAADCWFLDGFAPARNPSFWTPEILADIGRLTRPGGSLASFTSAGEVRRLLGQAGFEVTKRPGFGRKREMITGVKVGAPPAAPNLGPPQTALRSGPKSAGLKIGIIGGGIAGASVAAGLLRRGVKPVIFDAAATLASGASGNRMALQSPRLARDHNPMSRLSADCLAFAARCADRAGATVGSGVLALDWPERMAERHDIFRSQSWSEELLLAVDAGDASVASGLHITDPAMIHSFGRVIEPEKLVSHLAEGADIYFGFDVAGVENLENPVDGVIIHAQDGRSLHLDALVIAAGAGASTGVGTVAGASTSTGVGTVAGVWADLLGPLGQMLPLEITSGQVSQVPATPETDALCVGLSYGGYLTPALDGSHDLGASFIRAREIEPSEEGHDHNLGLLPENLAGLFADSDRDDFRARISQRASLPDRQPLMGQISGQVYALLGLGARGFTFAPLLGDLLAAEILGRPAPLSRTQRQAIAPSRYLRV